MFPVVGISLVAPTLAELTTQIGTSMTSLVPEFGVYAATGLVLGLAVVAIRRVVKGMR